LLKRYVQVKDNDQPQTIRAKVTDYIVTLDDTLQPIIPALFFLLDVLPKDDPFGRLDPSQRRQRTLEALTQLLIRESQVQPLLLVVEDLHWLDSETQACLDRLIDRLPTARLALLVTYRPEYQHGWGSKTFYTQICVDPLQPEGAEDLLAALLGTDPTLAPLKQLLIARTAGNPFFLEECVQTLVETQVLVGVPGAYRLVQEVATIRTPAMVQAVLAARIDRLPTDDKCLLQIAAVIGTEVPVLLLQAIAEMSEEALSQGLAHLQAAEFLYETSLFPARVYTFKHALTHEVAYGTLLQQQRRALHARIVHALERSAGARLDEQVERLVHHARQGEVWDKVLKYARLAGTRAADRSAYALSGQFFDHALEVLTHLPENHDTLTQGIELHLSRSASDYAAGDHQQQLVSTEAALRLAETLGEPYWLARALTFVANALWRLGNLVRALEVAERGLALAEGTGDLALLISTGLNVGMICDTLGNYRRGSVVLAKAAELLHGDLIHERLDRALYPAVTARSSLAKALAELGKFNCALATAEENLQIAEALQQPGSLLIAQGSIGTVLLRQGNFHDAVAPLEQAVALCNAHALVAWYPVNVGRLGYVYAMTGRHAEALPLLEQAIERVQSPDAIVYLYLAEAYLRMGRHHDADTVARRALALYRKRGMRGIEAYAWWILGEIATHHDPPASAETAYRQALTLADELGMCPL
jgi:tetratricopeptide (TPR) repeat protein